MNHHVVQPEQPWINSQAKEILDGYDLSGCFQQVNGVYIFSVDRGQGRPVVFIHGLSSSLFTWRFNLEPLSRFCRVIALDLPGFGFSPKPRSGELNLANYVDLVRLFLQEKGIFSVALVGHSLGGTICLELCRKFNGLAEALILVAATDKGGADIPEKKIKNLLMYLYHDKSFITPELLKILKAAPQDYPSDRLLRLTQGGGETSQNRVKVPCRIIWGREDALLPPAKAREVASCFQAAEISILPACGHAPQEEKHNEFNDLVLSFLHEEGSASRAAGAGPRL